jgi:hypothetical protein
MHSLAMGTKSRDRLFGATVRASTTRAVKARTEADKLACEAWTLRMLGFGGPAQPSPTLGDALNAGYHFLELRCLGCDTHQTSRSKSSAGRRRRPSMSLNAICAAAIAHSFAAIPTSAAISSRCARPRSRRATRRQRGGRGNDDFTTSGIDVSSHSLLHRYYSRSHRSGCRQGSA